MRLLPTFLLLILPFISVALAQDAAGEKVTHEYQSDVARLRKIVINSLYSHRDVFLRELISNSNDALEKLRIRTLTEKDLVSDDEPLNITIKLVPDEKGKGGRVIISDTGIGMTPEELTKNLGTLAKSGTSDFVSQAEADSSASGNLIGQFGLGFYSSFLVASEVFVASAPATPKKSGPATQYVFASSADSSSFEVYPDSRGNTLGHGTEITLVLKDDATEFLDPKKVRDLIEKHSSFSTIYPIYLYTSKVEEVPDSTPADDVLTEHPTSHVSEEDVDADEAIVEDLDEEPSTPIPPKMKNVTNEYWDLLNDQPPIWLRDPKTVSEEDYNLFYQNTYKETTDPLAYHHFSGDSGSTVSFKAILYIPSELPADFWHTQTAFVKGVRLMVKRVFITSDLGEDALPKWISWLRAIVDADDLPLNVSRETLQSTKFLRQIKSIIVKRTLNLLTRISNEKDDAKFRKIWATIGSALKMGAMEGSAGQKQQVARLIRWSTNVRDFIGLDQYVDNRKQGQKQIYYLAGVGQKPEDLAKSVFIEKLHARGYEVLLLTEPMDEILVQSLQRWAGMPFQDVAKKGLQYGDEDLDAAEEKEEQEALAEQFQPLLNWLKKETKGIVMDVILSNRLVTSPCAIVADKFGYSANMERMLAAQQRTGTDEAQAWMTEHARKQRALEINPKSPLIEGMLRVVEGFDLDEEETTEKEEAGRPLSQAEVELKEVTQILLDSALVRSGFEVSDPNLFFSRVDTILRRSLGVSETAQPRVTIKPAPPVEQGPLDFNAVLPDNLENQLPLNPFGEDDFPEYDRSKFADFSTQQEPMGGHDEL